MVFLRKLIGSPKWAAQATIPTHLRPIISSHTDAQALTEILLNPDAPWAIVVVVKGRETATVRNWAYRCG